MTTDVFFVFAGIPIALALLACFFSRQEDEPIFNIMSMFFLVMTLISCIISASVVQNNWAALIGSQNMGNPLMYLTTWTLWVGLILIAIDMLWKALESMYPEWAGNIRTKYRFKAR